jgi:cell division septation protein DedD
MESSFITGNDVAAIAAAPVDQDVRKRWLLLAVALVVGLVAAFAIGSAVKKTSTPAAPTGSLAQSASASAQHPAITALTNAGAVPTLHAPPAKPKVKKTPPANTSAASSSSSVSSPSTQSSTPSVNSTPVQSPTPSNNTGGAAAPPSSGTSGISHGGGGGQSAG